ncbi:MAG: ABC transporter permease [Bacteroidota bacterium]
MKIIAPSLTDLKPKRMLNMQYLAILAVIILICLIAWIVNPRFLMPQNFLNLFQAIAVLGIVASGVGMLLIAGEIDISVGAQVSVIGVVMGMIIQKIGGTTGPSVLPALAPYAPYLAVVAAVLSGALLGAINGITVVKTKAPSFIITLCFSFIYSGLALILTHMTYYYLGDKFTFLGRGYIFSRVPASIPFLLLALLISFVVLRYTKYGRFLYATGGNRKAAYVSGINTDATLIKAYIVVGLMNALAAMILVSRVSQAMYNTGDSYSLDALASIIVGGIALNGGKGSALSILLGVVLIGLISNALVLMSINSNYQKCVTGLVMLVAVSIGYIRRNA